MQSRSLLAFGLGASSWLFAGAPAIAQNMGFTNNTAVGATSRGSLAGAAGQVLARIDASDYAGWAVDPFLPGPRVIAGIDLVIQDQDAVTTFEVFDVWVYPEDPATPGFPLLGAGVLAAVGVAGPPVPVPPAIINAAYVALAFVPPVIMPAGLDIFIGFALPANPAWPADGLSVQIILGYAPAPAFLVFDLPGPALGPPPPVPQGPGTSYGLTFDPAAAVPLVYNGRRQLWTDVFAPLGGGAGGCVGTIAVEPSFAIAAVPPGTASFLSGLHPDAAAPPLNPGRADDLSFTFLDPTGAAVFVLFAADFALGPEIPVALILPGSAGVLCLPLATMNLHTLVVAGPAGVTFFVLPVPAAVRPILAGFTLAQQAYALLPAGTILASPCGLQTL